MQRSLGSIRTCWFCLWCLWTLVGQSDVGGQAQLRWVLNAFVAVWASLSCITTATWAWMSQVCVIFKSARAAFVPAYASLQTQSSLLRASILDFSLASSGFKSSSTFSHSWCPVFETCPNMTLAYIGRKHIVLIHCMHCFI